MDHNEKSKRERLTINVGSRNSQLALIQTHTIIKKLCDFYENNPDNLKLIEEGHEYEIKFHVVPKNTAGDQNLDKALKDIGTKSLFTKELETALIEREVDFVVHSLKDLPTTLPEGCAIGAISRRDDPDDTIVLKKSLKDRMMPLDLIFGTTQSAENGGQRYKIGTSSQRRIAMLRRFNDHLECINIRGNLNTRLAKLDQEDGEYSAIILARAGIDRMGWSDRVTDTLSPNCDPRLVDWCYAVGQGAVAVECRSDDDRILNLLAPITDLKSTYEVVSERSLMRKLEGGCSVPLGVRSSWAEQDASEVSLRAIVLSIDGKQVVQADDRSKLFVNKGSHQEVITRSELMELTTGIILSERTLSKLVINNLIECSKLGIRVANRMIDLGCLGLMRPNS